jgi:hypothetical protein
MAVRHCHRSRRFARDPKIALAGGFILTVLTIFAPRIAPQDLT